MSGDDQPCRLCLELARLSRSHIISEFLFKPLYDPEHRFIEVTDVAKGKVGRGQSGYRERLLCARCESHLNRFEKHSRRLFTDPLPPHIAGSERIREFRRLDYALLKLFFLSVLWRSSVSSLDVFKHVSLGPHEEKIRIRLGNSEPGLESDYPTVFFNLHFEKEHFRDLMVNPTYMRVEGRLCYRFLLSGFVVLIFVASHGPPPSFARFVLAPDSPVRGYDADFREFRFLSEVWDLAARTTKDVEI